MSIKVIDNFLDKDSFVSIKESLLYSKSFPWYIGSVLNEQYKDSSGNFPKKESNFQFFHNFYKNIYPTSDYMYLIAPIIDKIDPLSILRIKANLTMKTEKNIETGYHFDTDYLCKVAVYYVNSNNGYTIFKNGEKINSVENRIVIFDSNKEHSASTCTNEMFRCVINFNYIQGEKI
jgi:hypothetical protein